MLGVISQIPVLEKHRILILLKSVNGEKLYFMKVILLYLVLEKVGFQSISECQKHHCLFISIYGL